MRFALPLPTHRGDDRLSSAFEFRIEQPGDMPKHIPWFFAEAAALDVLISCSFRRFYFRGLFFFPKAA